MFHLKPIGNRCIIRAKKFEQEKKPLILITTEEKTYFHEIIAIGDDPCPVKVGDIVRVDEYAPRKFKPPEETGEEYFLIRYEEILAKLPPIEELCTKKS